MADREVKFTYRISAQGIEVYDQLGNKIGVVEDKAGKLVVELNKVGQAAERAGAQAKSGLDKVTGAAAQAEAATQKLGGSSRVVDELTNRLGGMGPAGQLASSGLQAVAGSGAAAASALIPLAVVAAGAAVALKLTFDAIGRADELDKMSQKVGLGVETLSKLDYAAKLSGQSLESVGQGVSFFSRKLVEARDGNEAARASFARVGVDFRQGLEPALYATADAFAAMADGETKNAAAQELFSRSGREMLPLLNEGKAGLASAADEAEHFGNVIGKDLSSAADHFNDNLVRMKAEVGGVGVALAETFLPPMNAALDVAVKLGAALNVIARIGITGGFGPDLPKPGDIPFDDSRNTFDHDQLIKNAGGGQSLIGGGSSFQSPDIVPFNIGGGKEALTADLSRNKQAEIIARADETARKQAESAQNKADADRERTLKEQLRIQEQIFKLTQDTAQLEASTVAGAAKTRLEQAERGLDLSKLTADQEAQLYALARDADAAERSKLEADLASLEATRDHIAAQKDLNEELKKARVGKADADVDKARKALEQMPSAVDELNNKLKNDTPAALSEIGKQFSDIASDFGGDLATAILTNKEKIGDSIKKALTAGAGRAISDVAKQLFSGLAGKAIDGLSGTGAAQDQAGSDLGNTLGTAANSATSSLGNSLGNGLSSLGSSGAASGATGAAGGATTGVGSGASGAAGAGAAGAAAGAGIAAGVALTINGAIAALKPKTVSSGSGDFTFTDQRPQSVGEMEASFFKNGGFATALLAGFAAAIVAIVGGIMNAVDKPPTGEGMIGKAIGDIFLKTGYQPGIAAGGHANLGSSHVYGGSPGGPLDPHDPYYPQVPLPASYADIDTSGAGAIFASLAAPAAQVTDRIDGYAINEGPVQQAKNIAASLGLNKEGAQAAINKAVATTTGNFDQGILQFQKFRLDTAQFPGAHGAAFGADDPQGTAFFERGVKGLIDAFYELSPAVDSTRLAMLALGEDGQLGLEALKRQIESAETVAKGLNLGQVAEQAFTDGGNVARTLKQNALGSAKQVVFDQIGQSKVGENFQAFTADTSAAAEAYRQGDTAKGNALLKQARDDYDLAAAGAENYFQTLAEGSPELKNFLDDIEKQANALKDATNAANIGANAFDVLLKGGNVDDVAKATGQQFGQIFGESLSEELLKSELFTATLGPALEAARKYAHDLAAGDQQAAAADLVNFRTLYESGSQAFGDIVGGSGIGQLGDILGLNGGSAGPAAATRAPSTVHLPRFDDGGMMQVSGGGHGLALVGDGEKITTKADQKAELDLHRQEVALLREQNALLRIIANKESSFSIDDASIARANDRAGRLGKTGMRTGNPSVGA